MAQNTVENISNLKLAIYCIYIFFFCQMRIDRSFTWNWKLIGCSVLCGLCPSPLHGCLEPESCCTSHSADRVCASLYPGNWPFQLKHKGNTGTSVSIRQPQEMLMYVLALLNTQVPHKSIFGELYCLNVSAYQSIRFCRTLGRCSADQKTNWSLQLENIW